VTAGQRQVINATAAIVRPGDRALLVSEHANPDGEVFRRPLGAVEDGPVVIWRAAQATSPPLYPYGVAGLIAAANTRQQPR
jgi:hypothetical protein